MEDIKRVLPARVVGFTKIGRARQLAGVLSK